MGEKSREGNSGGITVSREVVGRFILWALVALIGWLFVTVSEHDREMARRGVRIYQLEKKMEKLQDQLIYYKERLKG